MCIIIIDLFVLLDTLITQYLLLLLSSPVSSQSTIFNSLDSDRRWNGLWLHFERCDDGYDEWMNEKSVTIIIITPSKAEEEDVIMQQMTSVAEAQWQESNWKITFVNCIFKQLYFSILSHFQSYINTKYQNNTNHHRKKVHTCVNMHAFLSPLLVKNDLLNNHLWRICDLYL